MIKLHELTWAGREMIRDTDGYIVWQDTPVPTGGDRVAMGSLGMRPADKYERVTHFEVPCTMWGDYCGDSVNRSNYRSMLRDYPDTFIEVLGDYGSHYLAIPCGALDGDLAEIFQGLVEQYPLYDDEDHSNLEMEETDEQLEQWIIPDVRISLRRDHGRNDDSLTDEAIRERFYAYGSEASDYPYLEDAVTVYVPWLDDFVASLAEGLEDAK